MSRPARCWSRIGLIKLLPFFDLRWTENYGISYGMFTAESSEMKLALLVMTGLIALGVAVWMLREKALWAISCRAGDGAWRCAGQYLRPVRRAAM